MLAQKLYWFHWLIELLLQFLASTIYMPYTGKKLVNYIHLNMIDSLIFGFATKQFLLFTARESYNGFPTGKASNLNEVLW